MLEMRKLSLHITQLTRGASVVLCLEQLRQELRKRSCAGLVPSAEHAHRDAQKQHLKPARTSAQLKSSRFPAPAAPAGRGGESGCGRVAAACARNGVSVRAPRVAVRRAQPRVCGIKTRTRLERNAAAFSWRIWGFVAQNRVLNTDAHVGRPELKPPSSPTSVVFYWEHGVLVECSVPGTRRFNSFHVYKP